MYRGRVLYLYRRTQTAGISQGLYDQESDEIKMYHIVCDILIVNYIIFYIYHGIMIGGSTALIIIAIGLYIYYKFQENGMLFTDFRIKRLQKKILQLKDYKHDIRKTIEELCELRAELEKILIRYDRAPIDLRNEWGNLQKEIADSEAVICKVKLMFLRTYEQRKAYRTAKARIVRQLEEFLQKAGRI